MLEVRSEVRSGQWLEGYEGKVQVRCQGLDGKTEFDGSQVSWVVRQIGR